MNNLNSQIELRQANGSSNTIVVCQGGLKEQVLSAIKDRQGKFTAVDIAEEIGYPLKHTGVYPTCPNVRRMLTKLCKEGLLIQWITGNGRSPFSISEVPTFDVNYLRKDCSLAKTLLEHPNRTLSGYRIR